MTVLRVPLRVSTTSSVGTTVSKMNSSMPSVFTRESRFCFTRFSMPE